MYTFILILDADAKPKSAADLIRRLGPVKAEPGGRYIIAGEGGMEDGWMAITCSDQIASDYEPEVLDEIKSKIINPVFYLIESRDKKTAFADAFILGLDDSLPALIDNNHWHLGTVAQIKNLIQLGVDWRYWSPDRPK